MFSLGRSLLDTRGFTDVDGQIGLGSAVVDVAASAAARESWVRHVGVVVMRVVWCFCSPKAVIKRTRSLRRLPPLRRAVGCRNEERQSD